MKNPDIKSIVNTIPNLPGVYQMLDVKGQVLYVGKAKALQKRVASYFTKKDDPSKTRALAEKICDIRYIVTENETDALLLECELIKKENPKYNILLRDDKSYPYVFVKTSHDFPKLSLYRGKTRKDGKLFGPFTNVYAVKETITFLQKLFKLRTCTDSSFKNRSRPCLEFQINRCSAPCVNYISSEDYAKDVNAAMRFLQGKSDELINELNQKMMAASNDMNYELAASLRDQIVWLREVQKGKTLSHEGGHADVLGVSIQKGHACVYLLVIREGQLLSTHAFFPSLPEMVAGSQGNGRALVLEAFIKQYYGDNPSLLPSELICPPLMDNELANTLANLREGRLKLLQSPRGLKQKWQVLANSNAENALTNHLNEKFTEAVRLAQLQNMLGLDVITRIECFDISHTGGEATVASCVVFDEKGAARKQYRQFNIKGITGGDDYAAMEQAITRRYQRLLKEEKPLPEVLLIDGGKGQINKAMKVMKDLAINSIKIVGVAKGPSRKPGFETLLLADENREFVLDDDSPTLHYIQHIRDEAHRFAITSHRKKRENRRVVSTLEQIAGVGEKRRQTLLTYFGGMQGIKSASVKEIMKVPGVSEALAEKIHRHLRELP